MNQTHHLQSGHNVGGPFRICMQGGRSIAQPIRLSIFHLSEANHLCNDRVLPVTHTSFAVGLDSGRASLFG